MNYYLSETLLSELTRPGALQEMVERYKNAQPFPHVVLDNLFNPTQLAYAAHTFPGRYDTKWWKYDNILEKKLAKNDLRDVSSAIRHLVYELMEKRFVEYLEVITGIQGLIIDHTLNGGGLHQIVRGGKLDVHADYNYHPITRLDRRLNALLYLNEHWDPKWGGQLEFWDKNMTHCQKYIQPVFNRLVVFSTTDTAFHGHPEPLTCPEHESRKSIALYYYTNGRPESEKSDPHSTLFKRRPQDPIDLDTEALRLKRSQRRIDDRSKT